MRFTPTGVGTMVRGTAGVPVRPVHPHGRGDNGDAGVVADSVTGSPPRAWGQWMRSCIPPKRCRFTPTGVGTMISTQVLLDTSPVHPHGRGDNCGVAAHKRVRHGSPPRAWGQ